MKAGNQRKKFKTLSKLLNDDYRKIILETYSKEISDEKLKIVPYARSICKAHIESRNKDLADDKASYYGFPPIDFLCADHLDGTKSSKIVEFKTINNLLRVGKVDAAVEIVEIILAMMVADDKTISGFALEELADAKKQEKNKYVH